MTDLSPAAEAVLNALLEAKFGKEAVELGFPVMSVILGRELAAALRAAADQVVPDEDAMPINLAYRVRWDALQSVRFQLLAIANELEGQ